MIQSIDDCIRILKNESENIDPYCHSYIEALPDSIEYGIDGLTIQMSYILANCSQWKGTLAQETKKFIRNWIKEKRGSG